MKINFFDGSNPKNIAVGLIFISFVLIWQAHSAYPNIFIIQGEINSQETIINDAEKTLRRIRDFTGFAQKNKEVISRFDLILPDSEDKPNLLSVLDGMASSRSLIVLSISFGKEANTKSSQQDVLAVDSESYNFNSIDITMSLRGNYSSFNDFLLAIEKNLRVMDVVSVDFSGGSYLELKEGEKKIYSYNIKLKTYFKKSAEEKNITKLLSSEKFKNFTVESLNFTKEKTFGELFSSSDFNINIKEDEIGSRNLF